MQKKLDFWWGPSCTQFSCRQSHILSTTWNVKILVHNILNGTVQVDEDLHEDLSSVMEENQQVIKDRYPSDSFLGIFGDIRGVQQV